MIQRSVVAVLLGCVFIVLSSQLDAKELEFIDKAIYMKQSQGVITSIDNALAKKSDMDDWFAISKGVATGSSLAFAFGADSDLIKGAAAIGGFIALLGQLEKIDVYAISVKLNSGTNAYLVQPKVNSLRVGDKIILSELNGQAFVSIDKDSYTSVELEKLYMREIHFEAGSEAAKEFRKQCVEEKEKALRKKKGKFYSKGKAKCDLVPVVLVNGEFKVAQ